MMPRLAQARGAQAMPHTFSLDSLRRLAGTPDTELISTQEGRHGREPAYKEGSWGGRLMRNLSIPFTDRSDQQQRYMAAKHDVLRSLQQIYGKEIGRKAFRAGVGQPSETGGWETSANHPLAGRHIARMLEVADRSISLDGVLRQLAHRVGDPALSLLRGGLRDCPRKDLEALANLLEKAPRQRVSSDRERQLVADLRGGMGPLQALARNFLIETDFKDGRGSHRLLETPDLEGLQYHALTLPEHSSVLLRGSEVRMEQHKGGFVHCTTNEFAENVPGLDNKLGDKVHVSVHPEDVHKAWDAIVPIIYRHRDVFHEFKVTQMETAVATHAAETRRGEVLRAEKEALEKQLAEARADSATPSATLRSLQAKVDQKTEAIAFCEREIANAHRVIVSNQITIYVSERESLDVDERNARVAAAMHEIGEALRAQGVRITGRVDDSGLPIDEFSDYRRDKKPDGSNLRPEDADYPKFKAVMAQEPLYLALRPREL
jgi:hypothetical protein